MISQAKSRRNLDHIEHRPGSRSRLPFGDESGLADLQALVGGPHAASVDPARRVAVAPDASHYLLVPRVIATAADARQVAEVFRFASGRGRTVTIRSGGTSLSGQASGEDILLDTRRAFRGITVAGDGATVDVQPGATVRAVNHRLARYGRKLGPDPASELAATIGGVIANNSSGMCCGTIHNAYNTLSSLRFVLPSGTDLDTADANADHQLRSHEPALYAGLVALRQQIRDTPLLRDEVTRQYQGKNTMGYGLNSFLDFDAPIDILSHLMVGSEGTLGFIASARFSTVPVAALAATGVAVFPDIAAATRRLPELIATGVATIELMDTGSLRVARQQQAMSRILEGVDLQKQAALLVEFQADDSQALQAAITAAREVLGSGFAPTTDATERAELWHIRKGLYAAVAGARPAGTTALLEDVAVPVPHLAETCDQLRRLFADHGYHDAVIFGHAKDGNIHFLLNEDFSTSAGIDRQERFTEDLVELILSMGGTLKAEHGTGRIMAPFVERQFGSELFQVMRRIKQLADPQGILNPGVLLAQDSQGQPPAYKLTPVIEEQVTSCVECGYCEPSCPSKDLTLTPRQRISLRRARVAAVIQGDTDLAATLAAAEQYQSVDTCAACGLCEMACPLGINTADLTRMLRTEAAPALLAAGWNLAAKHWGAVTSAASLGMSVAPHVGALAKGATRIARGAVGADTVPQWSADLPTGGARRKAEDATQPAAVFFSACVGTMFAPAAGGIGVAAALRILCQRAGISLITPPDIAGLCCATPWKSKGLTGGHDEMSRRLSGALARATNNGQLKVICDNTSCTEGLEDALRAVGSPIQVEDALTFVARQVLPKLTVKRKVGRLVLHPTCASTKLGVNGDLETIANAVADQVTVPDNWGCCAFAGDRGMLHPELTASATRREAAEVIAGTFDAHASSNRTCEMGMSRATKKDYRHVLELLEEATA